MMDDELKLPNATEELLLKTHTPAYFDGLKKVNFGTFNNKFQN